MRLVSTSLGLGALTLIAALVGATCAEDPAVDIGLVLAAPQGLLDEATSVRLQVFAAAGKTCTSEGGPSSPPDAPQEFDLSQDGCAAGATWCGEITLPRDGSEQMFHVEARNATGLLAQGCATARIDQDPVQVSIRVVRYVPPPCCNDGVLQTGELCDTGQEAPTACDGGPAGSCSGIVENSVCECDCSTKEIPADRRAGDPVPAAVGQGALSLAFAPGQGQLSNGLRAVFQTSSSDSNADIAVRAFDADLFEISSPVTFGSPLLLQINCNGTSTPLARGQKAPRTAVSGSSLLIAFESNTAAIGRFDVVVSEVNDTGCNTAQPQLVSDGVTTTGDADIATGPGGATLVVWSQAGSVKGRIRSASGALGDELDLAAQGSAPRVAGGSSGWVVVHRGPTAGDDDGIVATLVGADGTLGSTRLVNVATTGAQDQPAVAMQPDGSFAVAWRNAGDVLMQRFDASGSPVSGDQENAAHLSRSGEQSEPAIAAGSTGGATPTPFYVVAWQSDGAVRARFFGRSSGFLFNPVDGQNADFAASPEAAGTRAKPAVAVGGNGHVAIGWQGSSAENTGVYVRRFPMPTP